MFDHRVQPKPSDWLGRQLPFTRRYRQRSKLGVSRFWGLHHWPVGLEKDIVISINHELKEEFEGRFSRCRNSLYFLALRTLGNVGEAEEAMENSYRKARRAARRFTSDGEFGSWMMRQLIHEIVVVANRRMIESSEMSEAEYPEAR